MRVRLFTLLVVPAAASLVLASLIVLERNGDYTAADTAFSVAELADGVESLDKALGDEALAASKLTQPEATYPRDVRLSNFKRAGAETDQELAGVAALVEANSYQPEIGQTVAIVEATLAFRQDVEQGLVSPLQILDRYSYIRKLLLDGLSHQAAILVSPGSQTQILALVDLIAARSAHLDERVGVELALRYGQWATGLHSAFVESVAFQEVHLQNANRFLAEGQLRPPDDSLLEWRDQLAITPEATTNIPVIEWTKSSDLWIHRLDTVIDTQRRDTKELLGNQRSNAASTQWLTLSGVGAALLLAMLLTLKVSVRLVRRVAIITRQAGRMASGQPTRRTYPSVRGSDELGQLASAFDEMITQIDTRTKNQWIESTVLESIVHGSPIEEVLEKTAALLGTDDDGQHLYRFDLPAGVVASSEGEPDTSSRPELVPTTGNPLDGAPDSPESRTAAGLAVMAVQREADQAKLEWRASHDGLTGFLSRRAILQVLKTAETFTDRTDDETPRPGLMYLDLDHFKVVNDQFGHAAGDRVLLTQTTRLRELIKPFDGIAGRVGGDEFLVLLPTIGTEQNLSDLAERLVEEMGRTVPAPSGSYQVGVSIGCVLSRTGASPAQLLTDADAALFEAKKLGRGQSLLSTQKLRDKVMDMEQLRRDVPQGIQTGQFVPWFQPIWGKNGATLVGLEALVRWRHPERGLVSPGVFLPVAEELNLLASLDRSIFEAVCRQVVAWSESGLELELVNYNLSTAWLEDPGFVEQTKRILAETGCRPDFIIAEVTESGLMTDISSNCHQLQALREIGVRIAVDDFGQGYSSLAYLSDLPVDLLKIDRRFVDRIDDEPSNQAIVAAVLSLGASLGLRIIAEGVERPEELDYLAGADCELFQGFLLAKPQPAAETTALLGRWRSPGGSAMDARLQLTPLASDELFDGVLEADIDVDVEVGRS